MFPLILAAAALAPAMPPRADAALGRWLTETRHGIVEITACGGSLCGRLVTSDSIRADPQRRDVNNRDPAQRQRPLKGLAMLQGFKRSGSRWDGGSVYNPEDGGTYHGTLTVVDADTLKVRGCIVWPLCKSQLWKRVN